MAGNNAPSFIPKRTPEKRAKKNVTRRIYFLSYISYTVFFGGLIASAGVFAYQLQLTDQLDKQRQALVSERSKFSQAEMERVLELEKRIEYAIDRVDNSSSIASLLTGISESVAETVQLTSMELERNEDIDVAVTLASLTDSFDSTLFQRKLLNQNALVSGVTIDELGLSQAINALEESSDASAAEIALTQAQLEAQRIGFDVQIIVPVENIEFQPSAQLLNVSDTSEPTPVDSIVEAGEESASTTTAAPEDQPVTDTGTPQTSTEF